MPGLSPDAPDVNPDEAPLFTDPVDYVNQTWAYRWALKAFQQFHPTENTFWDSPDDDRVHSRFKLYRYLNKGSEAAIFVLDSRSFRDAQLPPVGDPTDPALSLEFLISTFNTDRTLLGQPQLEQLMSDLMHAQENGITWKFVVIPEPIQNFGVINAEDRYEGYAYERTILLKFIDDSGIKNVVFLSADFHGTIVNNLAYQVLVSFGQVVAPQSNPVDAFEIVSGPIAFFNGRFGPAVVNIAADAGFISEQEKAFYETLPIMPDMDSFPNDKDDFVKALVNAQIQPFGYDPVGLNENLPEADGLINAELLKGDYLSTHSFTWTEFNIAPETQALTVTIWGTKAHSEADFKKNPVEVASRLPQIVSQFVVHPN
jgi:hypothetical protein